MTGTRYCMGCMQKLSWDGRCRFCGFEKEEYRQEQHHLPLNTTLKNGEYLTGKVLGEGGFGITYIGMDTALLQRVAIKEFYPEHLVKRGGEDASCTVVPISDKQTSAFERGMDSFLREGQTLAKVSRLDAVAGVKTYFRENGTAYLVMEYIDGMSIKDYVKTFGVLAPESVLSMIKPLIRNLQHIHEEHIFHRDISADNLIIDTDGKLMLIDFGAAKQIVGGGEKTNTVLYKHGYSALEQYSANGKLGGWTDVYGLCASVYYMLTGIVPEGAMERMTDDTLQSLCTMDSLALAADIKAALWRGMAVERENRYQSMSQLYQALYGEQISEIVPTGVREKPLSHSNISYSVREKVLSHTRMRRELSEISGRRMRRSRRTKWILGLGILALLLGMGMWLIIHSGVGMASRQEAERSAVPKVVQTKKPEATQSAVLKNGQGENAETGQSAAPKSGQTAKPKTKRSAAPKGGETAKPKSKQSAAPKNEQTAKPKDGEKAPTLRLQEDDHVAGDLHSLE